MGLRRRKFFKYGKQTATNCGQILENREKVLLPLKRILALPT